ncbi:metalloregulator ArsR/SmtB family transcription factor [Paraflavisolibacter sp. H34]|uniref:helix-turn-helix transcriptional regulator n=1 Tax=Huijunlia imazamoxiresistens TaxID=3127457 RepID=UPI003019EFB7
MENYKKPVTATVDKFLRLLKVRGPLSTSVIAKELGMTGEGARLQLLKLAEEGLVQAASESRGVGRPAQVWRLTEQGNGRFPDNHGEFSTQLIESIKEVLGQETLDQVIAVRERKAASKYISALKDIPNLEEKIRRLAELRNSDGYLAEWDKTLEGFVLVENHCPICAAAQRCPDLCDAEMNTFREIFGEGVSVERVDHIIAGSRRCAYLIKMLKGE